jgi:hypothetical protein
MKEFCGQDLRGNVEHGSLASLRPRSRSTRNPVLGSPTVNPSECERHQCLARNFYRNPPPPTLPEALNNRCKIPHVG